MLNFISFGSGSSGNCYYVYTENGGIIIDVGVGTRKLKKSFQDYGIKFMEAFGAIFVTHDHADHIKSVGSLCKKFGIPVFASKLVHSGMDKNVCMRCKIAKDKRMYVEQGKATIFGDFKVSPVAVPHDSTENMGYTLEHDGIVLSILTDAGRITDEMKDVIRRSNYLVIEANYDPQMLESGPYPYYLKERIRNGNGHLSNIQCGKAIAENYTPKLRHVWLCHLSEENNKPDIAKSCVVDILKESGINVGKDICVDVLNRKTPTGIFELV